MHKNLAENNKDMEPALKARIETLEDEVKYLQQEVKEAHLLLNQMRVPTNGVDATGNPGEGKRESLTLKQRITYLSIAGKSKLIVK